MINFIQWIKEAKKKGTKDSSPPTVTSSPLRGANQDQSGYNGKNSVADYTISDEKINELSPELVGKINKARAVGGKPSKTLAASKTLSLAVRKAWLKAKVGAVKEAAMVSTAGAERSTPGNMKSAGKSPNAMQRAADSRRMQLDKIAQQQKDLQQKSREDIQKKREQDAATRDNVIKKSAN